MMIYGLFGAPIVI